MLEVYQVSSVSTYIQCGREESGADDVAHIQLSPHSAQPWQAGRKGFLLILCPPVRPFANTALVLVPLLIKGFPGGGELATK